MKLFEKKPYIDNGVISIKAIGEVKRGRSIQLGVFLDDISETQIGTAQICNYDANWSKASISCDILRAYASQGFSELVYRLLTEYLTEETDVRRVTAHVRCEDVLANRGLLKNGFRLRRVNFFGDEGFSVNKYVFEKFDNNDYVKIGNGSKTMVILPGMALKSTLGSADLISEIFSMFSDYSIYLMDDRKCVTQGYTLKNRAGDVAALMKTLGIKDAYIYGASMGGMVAQYLAIDHPELVKKMFIASTYSRANETARTTVGKWVKLAENKDIKQLVHESIYDIYSESTLSRQGSTLEAGMVEVSDEELEKFIHLGKAVLNMDSLDELKKIKCPVMAIGSEGDRVLGPEGMKQTAEKLGCELVMYGPEYGHGVYDETLDVRDRMLKFFQD